MSELTLKIALSESLKFECSGNADFVARERRQFYRAAGREKIEICESDATQNELYGPDQPQYAACDPNNFGVLTRPTEITEGLSNLIFNIQHGIISVKMGDTLSVRLKDGTLTDFVITQIDGDFIRFESVDCIGGKYVTRDKVPDLFDDFWELLPDELKAAIVETPRKWIDEDGIENMDYFKLFLPSAPEVFPDDE